MIRGILRSLRPKQWTKNAFIFAALVFDVKLFQLEPFLNTVYGFILLCAISGTVYLINDLADVEKDRLHPTKKLRPIASGEVSERTARITAFVIPAVSIPLSFWLDVQFGEVIVAYLILQIAYTFYLKHIVIIDVMSIAVGFVLRVAGGVFLVEAARFSPWLYLSTVLLALFLGLGKRRDELTLLKDKAGTTRAILQQYNIPFLDQLISIVTTSTVIVYAFYTFSAENLPDNHMMMLTIPFVMYGIFRYMYVIHVEKSGGAPDEILLRDRPLQATLFLFGVTAVTVLYFTP